MRQGLNACLTGEDLPGFKNLEGLANYHPPGICSDCFAVTDHITFLCIFIRIPGILTGLYACRR